MYSSSCVLFPLSLSHSLFFPKCMVERFVTARAVAVTVAVVAARAVVAADAAVAAAAAAAVAVATSVFFFSFSLFDNDFSDVQPLTFREKP